MKSKEQVGKDKEEIFFCRAQEESSKEEDTEEPDEYLTIANYQVTSMEQNGNFIIEKKEADVACFEEHKTRATEVGRFKKQFKDAGWGMLCGPSDETKRNTSAGVGIMWNEKAKVVQEEMKMEQQQKAKDHGRVDKYFLDVGWEQNIRVYVCYGCTGDAKP